MDNFIIKITKNTGDELLSWFKEDENLSSLRKGSKDVVTDYDKKADEMIIKEIESAYPHHNLLTEESGEKNKGSEYTWIVDSLDGSGNFANGNPLFSVCIALMKNEELVLGATYAPFLDEFYFAKKGEGAFLNGEKISVTSNELKSSYLVFCDGGEKDKEMLSSKLSSLFKEAVDLRKIGSAGVETGWLASGRVDGFIVFQADPWDLASGALIVREAGGFVSDFEGFPWEAKRGDFIFSNSINHNQIKSILS